MALLEEANRINERDMMIRHEIEGHVKQSLSLIHANESRNHNAFE
jgi:hypothetical protein